MALEELLKQQEKQDTGLSQAAAAETGERGSLIRQAAAMIGQPEELPGDPEGDEPPEEVCCADGYVRRSPVQTYRTAEDYHRRQIRKAVLIAVGAVLAILLVVALTKTGLLRLR